MKLNQSNHLYIVPIVIAYAVAYLTFVDGQSFDPSKLLSDSPGKTIVVFVTSMMLPIISGLIPRGLKEWLVFWRVKHRLPGYRAFTKYAHGDYRIFPDDLIQSIGGMPETPQAENSTWYRLYNMHEADDRVRESNRLYLLYREISSYTVLTAIVSSAGYVTFGGNINGFLGLLGFLFVVYILSIIGARIYAIKLVRQVLAIAM
jgi:hypothetical protein